MTAASRWADALRSWVIPQPILDAAPQSPWGFAPSLFARAAQRAVADPEPGRSRRRAAEALPAGGVVLDVGVGGGAASLPLAPPAGLLVGVDESPEMLAAFAAAADGREVAHEEVTGTWPAVAAATRRADVVVCHHVLYNVADLAPFADALDGHARRRVVVEITAEHPQADQSALWRALHGLERPRSPTADDGLAVLAELGLDVHAEAFERPSLWAGADRGELIAFTRRRLCVGPERDAEIDALLGHDHPPRRMVTLWWDSRRRKDYVAP